MHFGIDVSHHQRAASVPWETIAKTSRFAFCRASYGAELRDREVVNHVRNARRAGLLVGLYHFYRPLHDVAPQLDLFRRVADDVGLGEGDIVPALDVEHDPLPKPGHHVSPKWADAIQVFSQTLVDLFGDCYVYITQREFGMLGKPAWLLERPLWVAHYTGAAKPATPGNKPHAIWQHRVGPYDPNGPGGYFEGGGKLQLDQNRAPELPILIGKGTVGTEAPRPMSLAPQEPTLLPMEPDWESMRASRNKLIRDMDDEPDPAA